MMAPSVLIEILWEQNRLLMVAVLSLLLLSIGLFLYQEQVVVPSLSELQIEQLDLQQQLRQRQATQEGSGELLSKSERIAAELQQFKALIPAKNQFADFLGELFSWAAKSDLEIEQITYSPKIEEPTGLLNYGLSFSVSGHYSNLKRFVHLLENAQRILIIDRISLAGDEKIGAAKPGVRLQIQLTTFFQEQPQ